MKFIIFFNYSRLIWKNENIVFIYIYIEEKKKRGDNSISSAAISTSERGEYKGNIYIFILKIYFIKMT